MEFIGIIGSLAIHLTIVLAPATIAGLALQRLTASRSRNRLLYGAIFSLTALLSIRLLADAMAGAPPDALLVIAALASPVGWGIILWVAWSPDRALYIDQTFWRDTAATAGADPAGAAGPVEPPLFLEAAPMTGMTEGKIRQDRAAATPVFRSRQAETRRWRPAQPLPFVPGVDRPG